MIEAARLLSWLQGELARPDLAVTLNRLLANNTLNDDLRLLEFCHALWHDMPAIWRGRPLSESDLRNAATAAERGDAQSLVWLQSLLDGRCFEFYSRFGHTYIEQMGHRYRDAWAEFHRAWDEMIQAGAPAATRQSNEEALPLVVATAFGRERRESLRQELRQLIQPVTILLCEDWFLRFGTDMATLSDAQLLILRHLARTALTNERTMGATNEFRELDLRRLGSDVVVLNSMRRLLRGLVVRPGVLPIVLRPGEFYRSARPQTLGDHLWERVGSAFRRMRTALVRRRAAPPSPPTSGAPAVTTRQEITAAARLVRVTAGHRARPLEVRDEYYLALVSWEASEGWQVRLKLTQPSLVLPAPRLRTDALPHRGRMLLLLTSDTELRVIARRGWFARNRTQPMVIRFGPKAELVKAREDLLHPQGTFLSHTRMLRAPRSRIVDVKGRIPQVTPREITQPTGAMVFSRCPTQAERRLAAALQSRFAGSQ